MKHALTPSSSSRVHHPRLRVIVERDTVFPPTYSQLPEWGLVGGGSERTLGKTQTRPG